jgi:cytoskeletal protein CcmA (bactofilin family)
MKSLFIITSFICYCIPAFAIRYHYGQQVVISKPVFENIYVAGGTILVNAPVHGDLVVAGGTVIINDSVYNDIVMGAGTVYFNEYVGGDIRCAGGKLEINGKVAGDILLAGGNILVGPDALTGSILTSGGNVTINGSINGNLTGIFSDLVLNGRVLENADCRGRKITINGSIEGRSVLSAKTLVISPGASFAADVRYWTENGEIDFGHAIENGKAVYDPTLQFNSGEWYFLGAATATGLLLYLGMVMILIFTIQYLFSFTMKNAAGMVFEHSIKSLLTGVLFVAGIPLAIALLLVTVIGIPVGLILAGAYIVILLLSMIISAVLIANWINNLNKRNWNYWRISFVSLAAYIVLNLFASMPFVGWFIMLFIICMALGSILLTVRIRDKQGRSAKPPRGMISRGIVESSL